MKKHRFVFYSAITGNILEYYDFTVYAVFTTVIGKIFFPNYSEYTQIVYSMLIFALGFLTRPLGGIIFGIIADKYGRRISLIISMLGMTIPTFIIGILPGYQELGIIAPIILAMMRLIQGFCISGEGTGAAIFVLEHYKSYKPGFTTGLVHSANIAGTLLAILVGIFIDFYFLDNKFFAWRYAFILGGIFGIVGFYLRLIVSETPDFNKILKQKKILKSPLYDIFAKSWKQLILTYLIAALASSSVYLIKGHLLVFLQVVHSYNYQTSLLYVSFAAFILMTSMPIAGILSDKYGNKKLLVSTSILISILIIPIMILVSNKHLYNQLLGILFLALLAGCSATNAYIFSISLFPPEHRATAVSFSYNLGVASFGGTTPLIATHLEKYTQSNFGSGYYIAMLALIFLIALKILKIHK